MNEDQSEATQPGAYRPVLIEHEWLIPELFSPCGEGAEFGEACGAQERVIRLVPSNHGKAIYCTNDHHHDFNGKTFIPAEEFGPGGAFFGILPPELTPDETELRSKRWKVARRIKDLLADRTRCAECAAEEMNTYDNPDPAVAWEWITEYDPELLVAIQADLRRHGALELRDWFRLLSGPVRKVVIDRLNMSVLVYDHGVPRKIGNQIWYSLSIHARRFLQESLIFKICRKCNGTKSSKLPSREALVLRYANCYFGGSLSAAKADARWPAFDEILEVLYGAGEEAV